jgi:hypothetical protein
MLMPCRCNYASGMKSHRSARFAICRYILIVLTADDHGEGGTFALYSLIARHAHIPTPSGSPNASDLHLSRYTSNEMVGKGSNCKPATVGERVSLKPAPLLHLS